MPAMAIPRKVRKNPRAQVALVARYRSPTAFEYVEEQCCDLSLGGMFIRSLAPSPAGTLIKLECDAPGKNGAIRGVARVVWLRERSSNGHPAGMGVKFIRLEPGARDAINALLDQLGGGAIEGADADEGEEEPAVLESGRVPRAPTDDGQEYSAVSPRAADEREAEVATAGAERATAQEDAAVAQDGAGAQAVGETPSTPSRPVRPSQTAAGFPQAPLLRPELVRPVSIAVGCIVAAIVVGLTAFRGGDHAAPQQKAAPAKGAVAPPKATPAAQPAPTRPQATLAAAKEAPAPSKAITPDAPVPPTQAPAAKYVLDVVTNPGGAEVISGRRTLQTPARLDFESAPENLELKIRKAGYDSMSVRLDPKGFALEDGEWHRRVVIALNARPGKSAPASKPREPSRPSDDSESGQSRLSAARRCLARGDNRCVIATLEGKAKSALELEMLVETYRAIGNLPKALVGMKHYVDKYPTGERAVSYRQVLERRNASSVSR